MTIAPAVWQALGAADVVLAVGTRVLRDRLLLRPDAAPPELDRHAGAHRHRRRAAGPPAGADIGAARRRPRDARGAGRRAAARPRRRRAPPGPRRCARRSARWPARRRTSRSSTRCARCMPDDGILVADSTQPGLRGAQLVARAAGRGSTSRPPASARSARALPMAIGAKIAAPDRVVACLAGDGGFLFTIQELATAAEEHLAAADPAVAEPRLRRDPRLDGPRQRAAHRRRLDRAGLREAGRGLRLHAACGSTRWRPCRRRSRRPRPPAGRR